MKLEIEQELVNKIASYLANRPWAEANNMIQSLSGLKEVVDPKKDTKIED